MAERDAQGQLGVQRGEFVPEEQLHQRRDRADQPDEAEAEGAQHRVGRQPHHGHPDAQGVAAGHHRRREPQRQFKTVQDRTLEEVVADHAPLEPAVGHQRVHQHREQHQQHQRGDPLPGAAQRDQPGGEQLLVRGPLRRCPGPPDGLPAAARWIINSPGITGFCFSACHLTTSHVWGLPLSWGDAEVRRGTARGAGSGHCVASREGGCARWVGGDADSGGAQHQRRGRREGISRSTPERRECGQRTGVVLGHRALLTRSRSTCRRATLSWKEPPGRGVPPVCRACMSLTSQLPDPVGRSRLQDVPPCRVVTWSTPPRTRVAGQPARACTLTLETRAHVNRSPASRQSPLRCWTVHATRQDPGCTVASAAVAVRTGRGCDRSNCRQSGQLRVVRRCRARRVVRLCPTPLPAVAVGPDAPVDRMSSARSAIRRTASAAPGAPRPAAPAAARPRAPRAVRRTSGPQVPTRTHAYP